MFFLHKNKLLYILDSAKLHKMVNNLNAMATFIKPTNYLSNYKRNIMGRVFANSNNIYVIDISCDNSTELLNRASVRTSLYSNLLYITI